MTAFIRPEPLVPADCNLQDFQFMPVDIRRLLTSETWMLGSGDARSAAMCLWLESWHQVPAASLPDNDLMLAHLAQANKWKKIKDHALRGWILCADERLYHPVVAKKALEAWLEKLAQRISGGVGNAKRWGTSFDRDALDIAMDQARTRLAALDPYSRALRDKRTGFLAPRSQPESPPESHPESGRDGGAINRRAAFDRKGQGEGEGLDKNPQPPSRGLPGASAPPGRKPRAVRDRSLAAWNATLIAIDHVKGTDLTWQYVTQQLNDPAAEAAIERVGGHKSLADRTKFTTGDLERRFREAYETNLQSQAQPVEPGRQMETLAP